MNRLVWVVCLVAAFGARAVGQCQQWVQRAGVPPEINVSPRVVFDEARQTPVMLFTRQHDSPPYNAIDLYEFDGNAWVQKFGPAGDLNPGPLRYRQGLAYHAGRRKVMLYGGTWWDGVSPTSQPRNDLWEWNGTEWNEVFTPGELPDASGAAQMVYDPIRDRLIVLTIDPVLPYAWRAWEWTGTAWEKGKSFGVAADSVDQGPEPLKFVFDESRGRAVLFSRNLQGLDDVREYLPGPTAADGVWVDLFDATPAPLHLPSASYLYDPFRRQILRVGGYAEDNSDPPNYNTSLEAWNPVSLAWETAGPEFPFGSRRSWAGACFYPPAGGCLITGGQRSDGFEMTTRYDDTWLLFDDRPGIAVDLDPTRDYCAGDNAVLSVTPFGAGEVEWFKDGFIMNGKTGSVLVLPGVNPPDSGVYFARVYNDCGYLDSSPCVVTVRNPATITAPPIPDTGVCPGDDFVIVGPGFAGSLPIDVQLERRVGEFWEPVPGQLNAVGNIFILANAQHADTGDYRFRVSNVCGEEVSDPFRVQVGVSIDTEPLDATPAPCEDAVFAVEARGVLGLSYQWFGASGPLVDGERVTGANSPTLTIHGVTYEDENPSFVCAVTDACETVYTEGVSLSIPGSPGWTPRANSGPIRRHYATDMAYDRSRGVSVLYGGQGPVSEFANDYLDDTWEWDGYDWVRRFPAHNPGKRTGHRMAYDPGRGAVLLVGGYTPTAGYNSEVWAYDGEDWTLLPAAPGGPPGSPYLGDAVVDEARNVLVVPVDPSGSGSPANTVTWELDLVTLVWTQMPGAGGPSYSASPVVYATDFDTVFAQYSRFIGGDDRTFLYGNGNWFAYVPGITPYIYNAVGAYDTTRRRVTLYGCCRDIGQPINQTETWAFNGAAWTKILPSFHTDTFSAVRAMLLAYDTKRRAMVMAGSSYNGSFGYVPLETWEYRYLDRVVFDRGPSDVVVNPGDPVVLDVRAAGYGTLSYQWRKGGTPLADGPGPFGSTFSGVNTPVLTISNSAKSDSGVYDCLVTNTCGGSPSPSAQVAVGPPCAPDLNGDSIVDLGDIQAFIALFLVQDLRADFNGDTIVDQGDIQSFIAAFLAGC